MRTKWVLGLVVLAGLALVSRPTLAGGDKVKVGDKAPAIESVDEDGKKFKLADHLGKKIIVLYFYPADFTGGCTSQACGFRDDIKPITDKGVMVIGVSGDSAKTHAAFKKEHNLPFMLLADEDGSVAKAYGVPFNAKKGTAKFKDQIFERSGTASRYTVVIDQKGQIAALYNVGKEAATDSKKILEIVGKLPK